MSLRLLYRANPCQALFMSNYPGVIHAKPFIVDKTGTILAVFSAVIDPLFLCFPLSVAMSPIYRPQGL